jgi:hypothetical protein
MAEVPTVAAVIEVFERALRSRDFACDAPEGMLGLLLALHENNIEQWNCEDAARRDADDDRAVAAAKRQIDALNTKRHAFVEAIDAAFAAGIEQTPSAPPASESPAMVFDRLSVLVTRIAFTERLASSERSDRDVYRHRLPVLHEQLALLREALEALFDDVQSGRKRFVLYQSFKLYRATPPTPSSHADGIHRD